MVHIPVHDIKPEDLVGNKRDPTKIKTKYDVPRMKNYHEEDMHHSEIVVDQDELDDARHHHRYDYKYKQKLLEESTEERDPSIYRDLTNME